MNDHAKHPSPQELRLQECELRLDRGEEQFGLILLELQHNTAAIKTLTEKTAGVVSAYEDVQAAARIGNSLQKVVVWLIKCGGSLAAIGWAINRLIENFKH